MSSDIRMDERLALAEGIIDHPFRQKLLGLEALMMAAGWGGQAGIVLYENDICHVEKNTRLAMVGDRMLDAVLTDRWYETGAIKDTETKLREDLTSNGALSRRGKVLGLDRCIMLNAGHRPGEVSEKMMATTVEALIGAVYLDFGGKGEGFEEVERVMGHLRFLDHPDLQVHPPLAKSKRIGKVVEERRKRL